MATPQNSPSPSPEAGLGKASTAEDVRLRLALDLSGRNVLITGANTGLGKETARVLARAKANVCAFP